MASEKERDAEAAPDVVEAWPARVNDPLEAADRELLERVAVRVVELHMEIPALLALETGRPLSVLAGQTLYFFEPVVTALLPLPHYRRFAQLIERREVIEILVRMIESRADQAHRERRATAAARRAARRGREGRS